MRAGLRPASHARALGAACRGTARPDAVSRMRRTPRRRVARRDAGRQALENGVVLAVDRQQLAPLGAHRLASAAARTSPALPCWQAARACRRAPPPASAAAPPRRRWPPSRMSTSGMRGDRPRAPRRRTALAWRDPLPASVGRKLARRPRRRPARHSAGDAQALLEQSLGVVRRSQRHDPEALRMARQHIQRADADAAGRAEHRDAARGAVIAVTPSQVQAEQRTRRRRGEAVDAIEHAAVARERSCRCP